MSGVAGSALFERRYIPVALSKSEGAGSVWILVHLPGTHLYIQVLGNKKRTGNGGPVTPSYDSIVVDWPELPLGRTAVNQVAAQSPSG